MIGAGLRIALRADQRLRASCWPPASPRCSGSRRSSSSPASPGCCRSPASRCRSCPTAARRCSPTTSCSPCCCASPTTRPTRRRAWPSQTTDVIGAPHGDRHEVDGRGEQADPQPRRVPGHLLRRAVRAAQPADGVRGRGAAGQAAATPGRSSATSRRPRGDDRHRRRRACWPSRSPSDDRFELQRVYPADGRRCSPTSPATSRFQLGHDRRRARATTTSSPATTSASSLDRLDDLFVERRPRRRRHLTVRNDVQQAARDALGRPARARSWRSTRATASVLAMWSSPTYDPNLLATHDFAAARRSPSALNADPEKPTLSPRPTASSFFPGLDVQGGHRHGRRRARRRHAPTSPTTRSPTATSRPATAAPIRNFGGDSCGGTLFEILQQSCNTAFAQMGVDTRRRGPATTTAQGFGFDQDVPVRPAGRRPVDLPRGECVDDPPTLAQAVDRPERRAGHPAADGAGGRRRSPTTA